MFNPSQLQLTNQAKSGHQQIAQTMSGNLNPSGLGLGGQKNIPMNKTGGRAAAVSGLGTTATTAGKSGGSGFPMAPSGLNHLQFSTQGQ